MSSTHSPTNRSESTVNAARNPSENRGSLQPGEDLVEYAREYAKQRPEVVALWCFGVGFVVGWKLKPW